MSSFFGYFGEYSPNLLEEMGMVLSHRHPNGFQRKSQNQNHSQSLEIGIGKTSYSSPYFLTDSTEKFLLSYLGIIPNFNQSVFTLGKIETYLSQTENFFRQITELDGIFILACKLGDTFYLMRDPAGTKVVYWAYHNGKILFSNEAKGLFADKSLPRRLRKQAVLEYFTFSFIPGENTMLEGIQELPPGHILKFQNGNIRVINYFPFEELETNNDKNDFEHSKIELRKTLEEYLETYEPFINNPTVFLSGGIDSSAVLALASLKYRSKPIKTLSIHFGKKYPNENEHIDMMVGKYKTDHTYLEITPKSFRSSFRQIIWYLDEPIGDPVTIPNYLISKESAKYTNVILNGEGGDPCFGGPKNIPMLLSMVYGTTTSKLKDVWIEDNYLLSYQRAYRDLEQLLEPEFFRSTDGREGLYSILRPYFQSPLPRHFLNKLMKINIQLKGGNLILPKVDKMTSANGVLALSPLFNRKIIQLSMKIPPHWKLNGNVEKWILKKAVEDCVPFPIIQRPKSGMRVPVRFWFQKELKNFSKKILSPKKVQQLGIFRYDYIKKLLKYDLEISNGSRHGLKLWMLITFIIWYEQMIENFPYSYKDG